MATTVEPPPAKTTKGAPPPPSQPSQNLAKPQSSAIVDLNFKVPAEFKREFDVFAAERSLKKKDLLRLMFEHYKRHAA